MARGQLQKNSTPKHDYIKDGFYAATPEQEMKSPDAEVNVLISMENVTNRIAAAIKDAKTPAVGWKAIHERHESAARYHVLRPVRPRSTAPGSCWTNYYSSVGFSPPRR